MRRKGEKAPGEQVQVAADPRFTPKRARNAVAVAKVLAPAAIPALAPFALKTVGAAREAYDRYQAHRLGMPVERLSEFTGRGAVLLARIAGVADGLTELGKVHPGGDDETFAERGRDTLRQLTAVVRAAERMPAPRRKSAHRAVAGELDTLETQLLQRLGV
jgi:hypothetical protein